jgi:hypothetical protein
VTLTPAVDRKRDSDFRSPADAMSRIRDINAHLAMQEKLGRPDTDNCVTLRQRRAALRAYLVEQKQALEEIE